MNMITWFYLGSAAVSILFGLGLMYFLKRFPAGNEKMLAIRDAIREGSQS